MRIRIPIFMLMRIRIRINLARERKICSSKSPRAFFVIQYAKIKHILALAENLLTHALYGRVSRVFSLSICQ